EWTTVAAVRVVREAGGAGASPTRTERSSPDRAFVGRLGRGSRGLAPWGGTVPYPATAGGVRHHGGHVAGGARRRGRGGAEGGPGCVGGGGGGGGGWRCEVATACISRARSWPSMASGYGCGWIRGRRGRRG